MHMSHAASRLKQHLLVATGAFLLMLAVMSMTAAAAHANYEERWGATTLPPGDWTTNGVVGPIYDQLAGNGGAQSICVGPVVKSGSGYTFPKGLACAKNIVSWEYGEISAAGAVYNDSATTFAFNAYNYYV